MTAKLQIILIIAIILYFIEVVRLLINKKLSLKYTLLWLIIGLCMFTMAVFPGILDILKIALGFQNSMNTLLVITISFAFILIMYLTSIDSKQTEQIKNLIQENAMLEKRVRELETKIK